MKYRIVPSPNVVGVFHLQKRTLLGWLYIASVYSEDDAKKYIAHMDTPAVEFEAK